MEKRRCQKDQKSLCAYIMVAGIGYAATGIPARWITEFFKKLILGDKRPG